MGEGKLGDRLVGVVLNMCKKFHGEVKESLWTRLLTVLYFSAMLVSTMFSKNLYMLLVLWLCLTVTRRIFKVVPRSREQSLGGEQQPSSLGFLESATAHLYVLLPCFSLVYMATLEKFSDFSLWLCLFLLSIKITIYLFENIFGDGVISLWLHPSKTIFGFLGSMMVSVLIGILSALFLGQRLLRFTFINVLMTLLIHLQDILEYKLKNYSIRNGKNLFSTIYNSLALPVSFFVVLKICGFIG
jgi:hypothetical protein